MSNVLVVSFDVDVNLSVQQGTRVLLVDSPSETIATKRVTVPTTGLSVPGWCQRITLAKHVRAENPECAVYWAKLDSSTYLLCVSDLKLSIENSTALELAIEEAGGLQSMHTQIMCVAAIIPANYKKVFLLINSPTGVRHVFIVSGKPVFSRQLTSAPDPAGFVEPVQESWQHLENRNLLDTSTAVMCHGAPVEVLGLLASELPDTSVVELSSVLGTINDSPCNGEESLASLASAAYCMSGRQARWLNPIPAYWLSSLGRLRYLYAARLLICASACFLVLMVAGSSVLFKDEWIALWSARNSIRAHLVSTDQMQQQALTHSSSPMLTAQRLKRLDMLRQQQAPGPDVLLAEISSVFEAHPSVQLNHISWFVVSNDNDLRTQTRISARQSVFSDAESSEQLSVMISGEVVDDTLSKRQATFAVFQDALLAINGVSNLSSLKTPLSQWQIDNSDSLENAGQINDNFTLRFSLDAQSS